MSASEDVGRNSQSGRNEALMSAYSGSILSKGRKFNDLKLPGSSSNKDLVNKETNFLRKDINFNSKDQLTSVVKLNGNENEEIKRESLYKSFNLKNIFERMDNENKFIKKNADTDNCIIYVEGPLEKYTKSSLKLEYHGKSVVTKMACGFAHMILLLENGEIFIEGLILHESINNRYEVVDIGCGSNHSVFLAREKDTIKQERKLLTCGYEGCLGVFEVNEDEYRLQSVQIPELSDYDKIEFIICRFNSSAILDNDNNLYYWGDDFDGFRERIPEKKNLFEERIVDLSFGFRHAVFLLENGDVYTWGDGTYGELSSAFKMHDSKAPTKINYFKKNNIQIIKVEAGSRHSLFLDNKGNVYGSGLTKGKNNNTERIHSPMLLEDISDFEIIDIFAGDTTSYAIDCNGIPYKWGGVVGKFEIISDISGRYISQVVTGNNNMIALA